MMNNPQRRPSAEARWAAEHDFDYLDLTIEPPRATRGAVQSPELRAVLQDTGLPVVGHLGWFFPLDLPTPEAHRGILDSMTADMEILAGLGAETATVHLNLVTPRALIGIAGRIKRAVSLLRELELRTRPMGIRPILEHMSGHKEHLQTLDGILRKLPWLGLNLDIGHANLGCEGNAARRLLERYGDRLAHVHLSDNLGRDDLHLPVGAGLVDWKSVLNALQRTGYEGSCTLEVFSRDREYLIRSREKVRKIWAGLPRSQD